MNDSTLAQIMNALQTIAQAVSDNDIGSYREAIRRARELGVTEEQVQDAYDYRNQIRSPLLTPVSFTVDGEPKA